jgi:flagellar hook-basal body complex protein FliE
MTVEPLIPDAPPGASMVQSAPDDSIFGQVLDALGSTLQNAQSAEDAFSNGRGSLQEAIYERARADVALSIATASAQRAAQAIGAIFNMQI